MSKPCLDDYVASYRKKKVRKMASGGVVPMDDATWNQLHPDQAAANTQAAQSNANQHLIQGDLGAITDNGAATRGAISLINNAAGAGTLAPVAQQAAQNLTYQNQFRAGTTRGADYHGYGNALDQSEQAALAGMDANAGIRGQQQSLGAQLAAQARGEGPNPAQEQLKQNLNLANQQAAGMIASQKGINPALAARLIAQNQGQANQAATSNAAQLQANQQLAAQGQLGSLLGTMGGQNLQQAGLNNQLFGQSGQLQDSQNATKIRDNQAAQTINAQIAQNNANAVQGTNAGLLGGLSSAIAYDSNSDYGKAVAGGKWKGGVIHAWNGGELNSGIESDKAAPVQNGFAQGIAGREKRDEQKGADQKNDTAAGASIGGTLGGTIGSVVPGLGTALGAGIGTGLGALGGWLVGEANKAGGGLIPGKPKVQGDSPKNDTVPAMLSPGEIVIPRSKATPDKAKEFVEGLQEPADEEVPDPEELQKALRYLAKVRGQRG